MYGDSSATLRLCAWCQAEQEAEFFAEDWENGAGTDNGASKGILFPMALVCWWWRRSVLSTDEMRA